MGKNGDFTKGKIYSIRSHQTDMIYIGSTCQTLAQRLTAHKSTYKAYLNGKYGYITSFKIISLGDAYIELIENFQCSCKDELTKREGQLIRETKNCVNIRIDGRTDKEYYEDNKKILLEKCKIYRENNKDKIKEGKKLYREENKEKIKEHKSKLITCECSVIYTHSHKARHERSKFHLNYINNKNKILSNSIETCPEIQEQEKQVVDV